MQLFQKLKAQAQHLKEEINVLMLAYRDDRTPLKAKLLIGLTIGYLLSPIDLIPDFIPILGAIDDLVIVPLLITISIKLIPPLVLEDARERLKGKVTFTKKNNWLFASIIVIAWAALSYFLYKKFKS